ncbi:MAG: hypothetical protein KBG48_09995 [Kofleriaceae bacterium]|nr:hypothetical protein [Kofleriaceae bacterium]MBP9167709.1 hypothetical protein [Kofleriaceae bacterium]MBP9857794.1 hypothetical protein [Kofleriaceae bacterium]
MSANSLSFAGLSIISRHAPVDRDALSVATARLASALDLRQARLSWTAKKRARRAFKESLLHQAIRDPAMESLSLSDDERLWYINLQFGSLSRGDDAQRRWQTVIAHASVTTAMLSFAADVGAQMGLVSACVAGYRDHWYARHEGTLVEIEGHVEPPNDRRLGEDAMLSHRAQTRLRRLYPITIIGPELWAQLPPMPRFDPMPTVEDFGDAKLVRAWPTLCEPRDPVFLRANRELRAWLWPYTIQNPADHVDQDPT